MKRPTSTMRGFTIIELMIAIGIFTLIMIFGISTLLNASLVHSKSTQIRDIQDNLSFVIEDMSRALRTGYDYRCYPGGSLFTPDNITIPENCDPGGAIAFEHQDGDPADPADQWVYEIRNEGDNGFHVYKSTQGGNGGSWTQMTSGEINLFPGSGFTVVGAHPQGEFQALGDNQQPMVTIRLAGEITYRGFVTPFYLQTSVSQRLVDVYVYDGN